jgi:hypothetical protein
MCLLDYSSADFFNLFLLHLLKVHLKIYVLLNTLKYKFLGIVVLNEATRCHYYFQSNQFCQNLTSLEAEKCVAFKCPTVVIIQNCGFRVSLKNNKSPLKCNIIFIL